MDRDGFTHDGWRAWQEAEAESRRLRHDYVGTERRADRDRVRAEAARRVAGDG